MTVSVDVSGLLAAFGSLPARVAAANHVAAEQAGLVYERFIKEEIQGGHPKGTKTGATPGGPPQNVTGNLRRSVTSSPVRDEGLRSTVETGPSADYGQWLEGKLNYPFVGPGAKRAETSGAVEAVVLASWRTALI